MKVIILQTDISWANPKANVQKVDEMLARCGEADLFVLPEMFSTGFLYPAGRNSRTCG